MAISANNNDDANEDNDHGVRVVTVYSSRIYTITQSRHAPNEVVLRSRRSTASNMCETHGHDRKRNIYFTAACRFHCELPYIQPTIGKVLKKALCDFMKFGETSSCRIQIFNVRLRLMKHHTSAPLIWTTKKKFSSLLSSLKTIGHDAWFFVRNEHSSECPEFGGLVGMGPAERECISSFFLFSPSKFMK